MTATPAFPAMPQRCRAAGDVPCAATDCDAKVVRGQVFCRPHYLALPKAYRTTIWRSFQARWRKVYGQAVSDARIWIEDREVRGVARAFDGNAYVYYRELAL